MNIEFESFTKIPRLSRPIVITEKIDGTNAQIYIGEDGEFLTGSRTRWIQPGNDNHGFSKWAHEHKEELLKLGPGRHFGEWWGSGIQRGYGLKSGEKHFSLFNVMRWGDDLIRDLGKFPVNQKPNCCDVVPFIGFSLEFNTPFIINCMKVLQEHGSFAVNSYDKPEGVVIYCMQQGTMFKKTFEGDEMPKSKQGEKYES